MGKGQKVPVTRRALAQRIARKLGTKGQMLRAERAVRLPSGRYYVVAGGRVVDTVDDLGKLGRELDVLKPWEQVVEEGDK